MVYALFPTYGVSFSPLEVGYRATRVFDLFTLLFKVSYFICGIFGRLARL